MAKTTSKKLEKTSQNHGKPDKNCHMIIISMGCDGPGDIPLLVEAPTATERSGSRSEADHAVRQGRLVLLWEPILGAELWAQRFVTTPCVRWIRNAEDIGPVVDSRSSRLSHQGE